MYSRILILTIIPGQPNNFAVARKCVFCQRYGARKESTPNHQDAAPLGVPGQKKNDNYLKATGYIIERFFHYLAFSGQIMPTFY